MKILCVFAHPDDETFGPGGTLAAWAQEGHEIFILCATRGEIGSSHPIHDERENELRAAAKILGIKDIEFLDFLDGSLSNQHLIPLERIITKRIKKIKPQRILTFNLNGVSGHMDHIAIASATTYAFIKTKIADELYYYSHNRKYDIQMQDYFIYFPEGIDPKNIDVAVDIKKVWDIKVAAMHEHKSQLHDVKRILKRWETKPKKEYFVVRKKKD